MKSLSLFLLLSTSIMVSAQRVLRPSDVYHVKAVKDPHLSPDGKWVAYTVSTPDSARDTNDNNIWMAATDGSGAIQLTYTEDGESSPRFSPDGRWISFLSGREKAKDKSQLWLMDRRGGEAHQQTKFKASISDYEWSPDGKKILFLIQDEEKADTVKDKPAKPIVIDRYHFKEDPGGYLGHLHTHLYVYDVATKKLDSLTSGKFDQSDAVWSPDSKYIAYASNRTEDPDRNLNSDLWIVEAKAKAKPRQLTTWVDYDKKPVWSPDGKYIAYLRSISPEWDTYDEAHLAIVPVAGGEPVLLSKTLDRPVNNPQWSKSGHSIFALIEDDRERYVMEFDVATKKYTKRTSGQRSITDVLPFTDTKSVVLMSEPASPPELYLLENGAFKALSNHNETFVKTHHFATAEGFTFKNKDGIEVGGILFRPYGKPKGQKLPLLLWIHGGPVAQDEYEFDMTNQVLAAKGYAVANINYRGSNGKGYAFSRAIFGDWGNKEVADLLAGVDYLVKSGDADPDKLAIGGWSYGGILTDYTTATDSRFKAAASGAGSALQTSMYGTDQYVQQYEMELGVPWKNMEKWTKVSYPFWNAEKIKTPTLYMVGESDFNVPAAGSEQMYQALRSLNVPTQLIIYPKQHHGLRVPSYLKDRYDRYWKWFETYLK
ncbi:MAG TPA: S9 family peptidase [Chryseolinea sp.]